MRIPVPHFRIKMVEPIRCLPAVERFQRMAAAAYNVFYLRSDDVFIDMLTDSGTSAMSDVQYAALITGDEAYAGSRSFAQLATVVRAITGMEYVIPVHQGRAAEHIFFRTMVQPGQIVPSNTHFDTTRANLRIVGAIPVDLPVPESADPDTDHPFKGNMDVDRLADLLRRTPRSRIPFIMLTLTNNAMGGQPVSMANVRAVREIADQYGIPIVMDIARYAENCYLIRQREPGYRDRSVRAIARELLSHADACLMSAKKDGLVHIGGLIVTRHRTWYERLLPHLIALEGFRTYGGLAGHDLAALAVGLEESLDETYLAHRIGQIAWMVEACIRRDIPVVRPAGGHALYLVGERIMAHVPKPEFPGQALVVALYCAGGIRAVEIGSLAFGGEGNHTDAPDIPHELVRLCIPRRVYLTEHLQYVIEVLAEINRRAHEWPGFRIEWAPPILRHFLARLAPTGPMPDPHRWATVPA